MTILKKAGALLLFIAALIVVYLFIQVRSLQIESLSDDLHVIGAWAVMSQFCALAQATWSLTA